ncbi:hypothetical protein TARUN_2426 [Trichoderma arundinaceum]|uniref:Uncharacterized protein n=1 Tax=Trichoderma arundinaceum TaxID=490622 RepID=A0A395NWH3_TRIAR|nr:hypothetical protein TARUN_2426 [Trichoderma arundinaceum]
MHQDFDGVFCGGPHDRPLAEMTREELLWDLRTFAEEDHRIFIWHHSIRETYKPSTRDADNNCLPSMSVLEVADTCNNFPTDNSSIVRLSKVICDEVEAQRNLSSVPNERLRILQPLFQALIIVVSEDKYNNEDSKTVGRLPVHLVRTGVEEGLSAPITFEPIVAKIIKHIEPGRIVQVTIETAIDFVMSLEARETAAFGLRPDPVTEWQPGEDWSMRFWREIGETGPLIGPSSRWVDIEKYPHWRGNGQKTDAGFMTGIEQQEFKHEARREAQRAARKRE